VSVGKLHGTKNAKRGVHKPGLKALAKRRPLFLERIRTGEKAVGGGEKT